MSEVTKSEEATSAAALPTGGQYFIDQTTGQYYYQSQDGETMTVVQTVGDNDEEQGEPEDGVVIATTVAAVREMVKGSAMPSI